MYKPNILIELIDGKPSVKVSEDADVVIQAYKASSHEAVLYLRPQADKSKNALAKTAKPKAKKEA